MQSCNGLNFFAQARSSLSCRVKIGSEASEVADKLELFIKIVLVAQRGAYMFTLDFGEGVKGKKALGSPHVHYLKVLNSMLEADRRQWL